MSDDSAWAGSWGTYLVYRGQWCGHWSSSSPLAHRETAGGPMTLFIGRDFSSVSIWFLVGLIPACSVAPWEGAPAKTEAAAFEAAFMRAADAGFADPECLDADIEFRFSSAAAWGSPGLRGTTDSDGTSWWRIEVMVEYEDGGPRPADEIDEILEHEFLHALLECGGGDWSDNVTHQGSWWEGLVR